MKKLILSLSILLIFNNSYAVSLDAALEVLENSKQIAFEEGDAGGGGMIGSSEASLNEERKESPSSISNTPEMIPAPEQNIPAPYQDEESVKNNVSKNLKQSITKKEISKDNNGNLPDNDSSFEDEALDDEFGQIDVQLQELSENISNNITTGAMLQKQVKKLEAKISSTGQISMISSLILFILLIVTTLIAIKNRKTMDIKFNEIYSNLSNNNANNLSEKIEDLEAKIAYMGGNASASNLNQEDANFGQDRDSNKEISADITESHAQYQPTNPSENLTGLNSNSQDDFGSQNDDPINISLQNDENSISSNPAEDIQPLNQKGLQETNSDNQIDIGSEINLDNSEININHNQIENNDIPINNTETNIGENPNPVYNPQEVVTEEVAIKQPSEDDFADLMPNNNQENPTNIPQNNNPDGQTNTNNNQ
ncbi:MAG: hypothetical protein ISP24_03920 [Rickettsiales bacterium]|nr:hypothetical protein [Rickettsiales bacterium]